MPQLRSLEIFCVVAKLKSFRGAAGPQNSADGFIADPVARLAISIAAESAKIEQN